MESMPFWGRGQGWRGREGRKGTEGRRDGKGRREGEGKRQRRRNLQPAFCTVGVSCPHLLFQVPIPALVGESPADSQAGQALSPVLPVFHKGSRSEA